MRYVIRNTLIPIPEKHRQLVLATLSMYDNGEDISDSPLVQSKINLTHMDVWKLMQQGVSEHDALLARQDQFISLYRNIKENGYADGDPMWVWFDDDGQIHIYDGYHRLAILEHLGLTIPVNVETDWIGGVNGGHKGKDFPLADILYKEHPVGEWLYQPVNDPRVSGWRVARPDSPQRLEFILRNLVGKTVLDVGCSEGYFSREIARHGYCVTAIDHRHGFIAAARYLSVLGGLDVDYHQANDWKEFVDNHEPYDNILLLCVIHNDMKKVGVEAGLRKLESFRGKAKRLFLEAPQEIGEKEWMVPGFPQFNFLDEFDKVGGALGLDATSMWSLKPGSRPIFTFDSEGVSKPRLYEPRTKLVEDVSGHSMHVLADEPIITPYIVKDHSWEHELTTWIKGKVKPGDVFVDVGANIGYFTLLASKLVGGTGKVYAFEPAQDCFEVLIKNIELNNCRNVQAVNKAVGCQRSPMKLYNYGGATDSGRRGLTRPADRDERWLARNPIRRESSWSYVDVTRLQIERPPDFVKIDVEGGELDVLESMKDILRQGKTTVILEDESDKMAVWIEGNIGLRLLETIREKKNALCHYIYGIDNVPWWDLNKYIPDWRDQYWPLFQTLRTRPCGNILEIGTHNGKNGVVMIKTAAQRVPESEISYYGVDLFEDKTDQVQQQEFTPVPTVEMSGVKAFMESETKAKIHLFKGNTRVILEALVKNLPKMDLIYIDGGHSVDTTRNDWKHASTLMHKNTVVYFDDYDDEMPFIGSHFIRSELDPRYEAKVMPNTNYYKRPFGRLKCQLLRVTERKPAAKLKTEHFRFHMMSLPHSRTVKNWGPCAFTMLTYRFCKMMTDLGHEVYHYGTEGADVSCTEHIDVLTEAVQRQAYGDWSQWKQLWIHNGNDVAYTTFRKNAIAELNRRKEPGDILLISNGNWLREISDKAGQGVATIEPYVGYLGYFAKYKVFPSYAWMHHMYGKSSRYPNTENFVTGNWYDAVIPHFFDPDDYTYEEKKDDYFLYLGRLIERKGIHIAVDLCRRIGAKLYVAGQPLYPEPKEKFEWSLKRVGITGPNVEYLGVLDEPGMDKWRSKARALIAPSIYMEPFGLVVPEALFSGTPVITTDWGAFTETVRHGEVGYRCRTMDDFIWAANNIHKIDPKACREYAVKNFSMDRIGKSYHEYFVKVHDLFDKGWYAEHPEREDLDWLRRY